MISIALLLLAVALLLLSLRMETRAAAVDRRRATVQALRRLRRVVGTDEREVATGDVTTEVTQALVDVLHLRSCWYEAVPSPIDPPVLRPDGSLSSLVQHRIPGGTVLPGLVALEVPDGGGRYLLVGDPAIGTTPEERLIASTLVAAVRVTPPAARTDP